MPMIFLVRLTSFSSTQIPVHTLKAHRVPLLLTASDMLFEPRDRMKGLYVPLKLRQRKRVPKGEEGGGGASVF